MSVEAANEASCVIRELSRPNEALGFFRCNKKNNEKKNQIDNNKAATTTYYMEDRKCVTRMVHQSFLRGKLWLLYIRKEVAKER